MSKDKGVFKRYVVVTDEHYPLNNKAATRIVAKAIEIIKPTGLVRLGDLGEWESVNHWRWKRRKRPPLEYQVELIDKEIIDVVSWMDVHDEACDKAGVKSKIIMKGNHEVWLDNFVEENPFLTGYTFEQIVKRRKCGSKVLMHGAYHKLGKLALYHGDHYSGQNHGRAHVLNLGVDVMYGHHHDISVYSKANFNGPVTAYSIGCLKDLSYEANKWLKNRKHKWKNSFAIVSLVKNDFFVEIVEIKGDTAFLWGEKIKG